MLLDKLQADLKDAQLARDSVKVATLRLLLSETHNAQILKGAEVSDQDVSLVLGREAKKRKEAATAFRSGGREESALKEEAELKILESYLPSQMSSEELTKIIEDTINGMGAISVSDMGKVMGAVMGKIAGRADGGTVSVLVKEKLQS